ncbi:HAMP domain-containing histidine kinase [bacterium]|nr:HAMP domain-containing histidine kinase [bacterium]
MRFSLGVKIFLGYLVILAFVGVLSSVYLCILSSFVSLTEELRSLADRYATLRGAEEELVSIQQSLMKRSVNESGKGFSIKEGFASVERSFERESKSYSARRDKNLPSIKKRFAEYRSSVEGLRELADSGRWRVLREKLYEGGRTAHLLHLLERSPAFVETRHAVERFESKLSAYVHYQFYTQNIAIRIGKLKDIAVLLKEDSLSTLIQGVEEDVTLDGVDSLFAVLRWLEGETIQGIEDGVSASQGRAAFARRFTIIFTIGLFVISFLVAIFVSRRISEPMRRLQAATRYASKGHYDRKIPVTSDDETGELTKDFNRMLDELGKLDRMKSEFVASITHDLKSPLATIKQAVQLLEDEIPGPIGEQQRQVLSQISKSVTRLSRLIADILDISKLEAGLFKMEVLPVDVPEFLDEIIESFATQAEARGVTIHKQFGFSHFRMKLDPKQMERAVGNVLANAIKYTPKGGKVTVRASLSPADLEIAISDTGIGIPKESVEHIFDKFYQVRSSGARKGSGLGLAITKEIVVAHGGSVRVESEEGKGTTVYLLLPRRFTPPESHQAS